MDNTKEIEIIKDIVVVGKDETCIYENKIIYMYRSITCSGTLIIKNCHIIYGDCRADKDLIDIMKGGKAQISNCTIEERGEHYCAFLTTEKLNEQDDVVIDNCKFIQKYRINYNFLGMTPIPSYVEMKCGGIIKNCEFNIKTKTRFGIIKGLHDSYYYNKNKVKKSNILEGEDLDYENYLKQEGNLYINVKKASEGRQTLVNDCTFNKSYIAVYKNCVVRSCTFNKCKEATKDVYKVKNCIFNKCKKALCRNKNIDFDYALTDSEFNGCKKKIYKNSAKKAKRKEKIKSIFWNGLFALFLFFAVLNYKLGYLMNPDLNERFYEEGWGTYSVEWYVTWRVIVILILLRLLLSLIKRISIKIITRKLKYDFKKSITSVILLLTLSSGIAYFSGILAKDIVLLYKDGAKKITTSDYTLRILSVNDKNERKEITKEEAIKMQEPYASDDDVIYSITFDGMKFDISENQYNDLCTYDGEISIVYYNKPHAIASITHN